MSTPETTPTYTIMTSLGLGGESTGIDDTTAYIIIGVFCCFMFIGSGMLIFVMSGSSGISGGGGANDIIAAISASNAQKLPVTLNINTSPQYYPKN